MSENYLELKLSETSLFKCSQSVKVYHSLLLQTAPGKNNPRFQKTVKEVSKQSLEVVLWQADVIGGTGLNKRGLFHVREK